MFKKMFGFLKPAPYLPQITDQKEIDKTYKYWRFRVMYAMYIGYACFYFTRKSFTFAMPALMSDLHFTKADMGIIASIFYVMYGVSKFISGMLSDRSNPKYFMSIGLILTGVINILFGLSSSFVALAILWLLNGFFQGWGWPPCARILTTWYSQKERGVWWGIWNTSHNVGAALIPIIVAFCATYYGWRGAMIIPGVLAIFIGFIVMNRMSDVPQSRGLPTIEDYKNDHPFNQVGQSQKLSILEILVKYILKNKYLWILAFSFVPVYIVRTAINDWAALFLTEKGETLLRADSVVSFFEVGGFFGSLVAGWASDKIFSGSRCQVNVIFSIGILFSVLFFWIAPHSSFFINACCLFAIGFLIFGPQMLIGMTATELSHKDAAGTSSGFVNLFAYLGAALSGYPLALVMKHFGWNGFFITIIGCSAITIILLSTMWSAQSKPKENK